MLKHVHGWRRLTFEQREPGRAALQAESGAIGALLIGDQLEADTLARALREAPGTLQVRTYSPAASGSPGAVIWEAGALASLESVRSVGASLRSSRWSARLVRYSRTDPGAAFARLESEHSP